MTTDITHRFDCPDHGMFTVIGPRERICPIRGICPRCRQSVVTDLKNPPQPGFLKTLECNGHCEIIENRINSRFHFANGHLVKTTNGQPIPHDEPIWILRGRDRLVLPALEAYRMIAIKDGCNEEFLEDLDSSIKDFRQWAIQNYDKMKQPNVTKGR